ncbi:MAG: hypothetical protein HQM08_26855 [Candidatus Riflebacteria bacterium]|nr:hypothetical protein [Candidatus Riflebacteria bacterium]
MSGIISYSTLEEAHLDIARKNTESFLRRIADTFHKGIPARLGIFYFYKNTVYHKSIPWNDESVHKDDIKYFRSFDCVHEDAWVELKQSHPELPNVGWREIPRGRVFYSKGKLIVEHNPSLSGNEIFEKEIIQTFYLPPKADIPGKLRATVFKPSEFYAI